MPNAPETFDAHADGYDSARRRLIPPFDCFYATATAGMGIAGRVRRVVDLGAGTGLLSAYVRDAYPQAALTLVDAAPAMLAQARQLLGDRDTEFIVADLQDAPPDGPWDCVVSALAIHHLSDERKRELFARVHASLRPGGVFVNAEQVNGPSPRFSALYARWHEQRARLAGSDDGEWSAAVERMTHDRLASVEDQLTWLRQARFADADCLFKDHRFAVIVALR